MKDKEDFFNKAGETFHGKRPEMEKFVFKIGKNRGFDEGHDLKITGISKTVSAIIKMYGKNSPISDETSITNSAITSIHPSIWILVGHEGGWYDVWGIIEDIELGVDPRIPGKGKHWDNEYNEKTKTNFSTKQTKLLFDTVEKLHHSLVNANIDIFKSYVSYDDPEYIERCKKNVH
jgi:hypothetical protein